MDNGGWMTHSVTGERIWRFVPAGESVKGFKVGDKVMLANPPKHPSCPNQSESHPWTITSMDERANGDLVITAHSDRFIENSTYGWTTLHHDGFRPVQA